MTIPFEAQPASTIGGVLSRYWVIPARLVQWLVGTCCHVIYRQEVASTNILHDIHLEDAINFTPSRPTTACTVTGHTGNTLQEISECYLLEEHEVILLQSWTSNFYFIAQRTMSNCTMFTNTLTDVWSRPCKTQSSVQRVLLLATIICFASQNFLASPKFLRGNRWHKHNLELDLFLDEETIVEVIFLQGAASCRGLILYKFRVSLAPRIHPTLPFAPFER